MLAKLARTLVLSLVTLAPLACDKQAKDEPPAVEVLPAPTNGSPIAAKFVEFTGEGERGMNVLLYNSGDKTAASYFLLFRYYDASDKLLKVKPGTPFESDQGFTSMSGGRYKCEPKQNVKVEIDPVLADVPAEAVRAEVLATSVQALGADGRTIEDWWSQDNLNQWPTP
ncbi:hypothetical protein ACNOYE_03725 [Nannocystaceae bacterium ST9]